LEGVERMVGLFVNTIPVRIRYEEQEAFTELIQRLQEEALQMEGHQYVSLAEIQTEARPRQHLLDHLLIFENYPLAEGIRELSAGALLKDVSGMEIVEQTNYDLTVTVQPGRKLMFRFAFNRGIYEEDVIERLGPQLKELARLVLEGESKPLHSLHITVAEPGWNTGRPDRSGEMGPEMPERYLAARNETELQLVSIWSGILGIPESEIGIKTRFFDLGGHSLNIIPMINRIKEDLEVEVALVDLMKTPSVEAISELVRKKRAEVALIEDILNEVENHGDR
jgi:acyl carrier protein